MISDFLQGLTTAQREDTPRILLEQRYGRILSIVYLLGLILAIGVQSIASQALLVTTTQAVLVIGSLVSLALIMARYIQAGQILLIMLSVAGAVSDVNLFVLLVFLAAVITAALAIVRVYVVGSLVLLVFYGAWVGQEIRSQPEGISDVAFLMLLYLIVVASASAIIRYTASAARSGADISERNARLLGATARIGELTSSVLKRQEMFERSVEFIRDSLGYYHVQVFLVEDDAAALVASTGVVGRRMLEEHHRLSVGSNSVIGQVTRYGRPVLVSDTVNDGMHRFNPLLPHTRSELGVPILDGNQTIGAMDFQSASPDAFSDQDVQALQTMGNMLAAALRNARLFEQQERAMEDQQRLYLESEANLREIRRLNRQLTRIGWDDYVSQTAEITGVTLRDDQLVPAQEWSESLRSAAMQGQAVFAPASDATQVLAVPVRLRGEVIGAIEVEVSADMTAAQAQDMVEAVAQRLATSLDNARLFEEAQIATAQEQRMNTIIARYQSAASVDDLLQVTLRELGDALGAQRGAIRLGRVADGNGQGGTA